MHTPVLLKEVIENLAFQKGDIFLDATVNRGGHSLEVCKTLGKDVKIIGLDLDSGALREAKGKLRECDFTPIESNFRNLDRALSELGIKKADKILFDLGLSMEELLASGRGFSFSKDEPLLMTLKDNPESGDTTARDVLNSWSEETLGQITEAFGEERFASRIAREIVQTRKARKFETTFDLVEAIGRAIPAKFQHGRIHFATKTFQAIRMAVNDEFGALEEALPKALDILNKGGRLAVITFHSIEDRVVKQFFNKNIKEGNVRAIGKKPIKPEREEILKNKPSRSAKLRVIEKINE